MYPALGRRHFTHTQKLCLVGGILISGIFGCTGISRPIKIVRDDAGSGAPDSVGGLVGLDSSRESGGGEARGDAAGPGGDSKISTDGARGEASVADGPSSGGGSGGSGGSGGNGGNGGIDASGGGGTGGAGGGTGGAVSVPDAAIDVPAPPIDAPSLGGVGATCSVSGDCAAGYCVDGICCDGPCGECKACKQTFTGKDNGVCAPITGGQDPHLFCQDETDSKKCGNDGFCDGAGACRKASSSVVCTQPSCKGTVFTPAATCDGKGNCPVAVPRECAPSLCATTGCSTTCSLQSDCDTNTSYCDTTKNTCASKLPNGTAATSTFQCTSGAIADGVCCDKSPCSGCMACTKALNGQTDGQCLNVLPDTAGHGNCTAATAPCGTTGMCDGSGKCQYGAKGTGCGSTCTGATFTPKACDGTGLCAAGTPKTCDNSVACAGDICGTKKVPGVACSVASDCDSGFCKDNLAGTAKLCCSADCSTCQGCNASGTGCTKKNTGATDPACSATCQNGTCNNAGGCAISVNASCGDGQKCSGAGSLTSAYLCNETGVCAGGVASTCASGACLNTTTCADKKGPGLGCSSGTECVSNNCVNQKCCSTPSCPYCQACNIDNSGTCKATAQGSTDPACTANANTCIAGGCNGIGGCTAVGAGIACRVSEATCDNTAGGEGVGQWRAPSASYHTCNGSTGTAACEPHTTCPLSLVCAASGTACRTSCTKDADCIDGYYCSGGGSCVYRKTPGNGCSRDLECQSRVCVGGVCVECDSFDDCPHNKPACISHVCHPCYDDPDLFEGDFCVRSLFDPTNPSGSMDPLSWCGARTYPIQLSGTDECTGCGSGTDCPSGQVCLNSTCRNHGGQPCVQNNCTGGNCQSNGTCPLDGIGDPASGPEGNRCYMASRGGSSTGCNAYTQCDVACSTVYGSEVNVNPHSCCH